MLTLHVLKTNHKPKPNNHGFSLVELLVVVAILAILAAIAIPLFLNQKAKSLDAVVKSDMRNLATEFTANKPNPPGTAIPIDGTWETPVSGGTFAGWKGTPGVGWIAFQLNCSTTTGEAGSFTSTPGEFTLIGFATAKGGPSLLSSANKVYAYDSRTSKWFTVTGAINATPCLNGNAVNYNP